MENRVFFPQALLDAWIVAGTVDLQKGELTLVGEGRRYALEEAVRVMREVSGAGDASKLVGRVKTRAWLEPRGGEIVESSMLIGDAAYDVEPGWVGTPVGPLPVGDPSDKQQSDEELLSGFLSRNS